MFGRKAEPRDYLGRADRSKYVRFSTEVPQTLVECGRPSLVAFRRPNWGNGGTAAEWNGPSAAKTSRQFSRSNDATFRFRRPLTSNERTKRRGNKRPSGNRGRYCGTVRPFGSATV